MKLVKSQAGFLMIVAVALIIILGFLGIAAVYIFTSNSRASTNQLSALQALYQAEAGLERGTPALVTSILGNRIACASLTGNANVTNINFTGTPSDGYFTVTGGAPSAPTTPSQVSGALNNTATTITATAAIPTGAGGYGSSGVLMIDSEIMNYGGISGSSFLGVIRGLDGTTAASHASGARIAQYQCRITSTGGVPNLTSPVGKQVLAESVHIPEGWAVAAAGTIVHWNKPTELQWAAQTSGTTNALNAVSMVSNAEGWAVGASLTALHYNGNSWTSNNTGIPTTATLTSVSTVSSAEAWTTVNITSPSTEGGIYKYNGTSWVQSLAAQSDTLNSISMYDGNNTDIASDGWAVGITSGAFHYNGSTWTASNSGITASSTLNGVFEVSPSQIWIVGNSGRIFESTNDSSWSTVSSPTTNNLAAVSMFTVGNSSTAADGWAVGAASTAIHYNGSTWASQNTGITASTTLTAVYDVSTTEAWAVGSSGRIFEWNGTTWTAVTSNTTNQLNGVAFVTPNQQPEGGWQQIYP